VLLLLLLPLWLLLLAAVAAATAAAALGHSAVTDPIADTATSASATNSVAAATVGVKTFSDRRLFASHVLASRSPLPPPTLPSTPPGRLLQYHLACLWPEVLHLYALLCWRHHLRVAQPPLHHLSLLLRACLFPHRFIHSYSAASLLAISRTHPFVALAPTNFCTSKPTPSVAVQTRRQSSQSTKGQRLLPTQYRGSGLAPPHHQPAGDCPASGDSDDETDEFTLDAAAVVAEESVERKEARRVKCKAVAE
jgi:hypothetical protein